MTVLVAMSGGVDSSVAAALLREQGHDVVGMTMRILDRDDERLGGGRGRCGLQAVRDAARVCAQLGIPHYALDFREIFEREIVEPFAAEYARGRTPNPCIVCNDRVKFGILLERLADFQAEKLATGHHACICRSADGSRQLLRGRDPRKDQSYFLYRFTQQQLARVLMPVGELTKDEVRDHARQLDLPTAERPESQEICFIPDDDYVGFLRRRQPELLADDDRRSAFRPGPVIDEEGNLLGEHPGIAGFTVGQRRGLGLAFGERRYVVRIEPETNALVLGTGSDVMSKNALVETVSWVSGTAPAPPVRATAKVRYQHEGALALVDVGPDVARVIFDDPQLAIAPGQAMVFYDGDVVLGGGVISTSSVTGG